MGDQVMMETITTGSEDIDMPSRRRREAVWDRVVAGVVIANSAVVGIGLLGTGLDERVLDVAEVACLAFFCIELLIRFWTSGWRADGWMLFDSALIVIAVLPVGGTVLALRMARLARAARMLHLIKHAILHLRHLRVIDPILLARCSARRRWCIRGWSAARDVDRTSLDPSRPA
jgi:hypothetical protein